MKKIVPFLAVIIFACFAGCAGNGVSVKVPAQPHLPSVESGPVERGKLDSWRPAVTVENLQGFDAELYADLRRNFIEPLAHSPYRYAIDSITLAAVPDVEREWTLLIGLDNGAAVRVENFLEWDEARNSFFSRGYKRALTGLEQVRRKDSALNRYVTHWTKPRKVTKMDIALARTLPSEEMED